MWATDLYDHAMQQRVRPRTLDETLRAQAEGLGLNACQLFGILRVAVTGQTVSPPLFESMEIIGREKVVRRLRAAIYALEQLEREA